ncbi:hypothetical protein ACOMHN_019354 [Nucella lapillus]
MPSVIIAGQTTMPSVIIAGQTTMPSVIIAGQTTMPSVIIAGQTTMPSVIIAGQTTMPSVIIAGQTTMPSVIIAGQTTMPSVIIAGQTTMPSVIIAGQTTMPSVIIAGQTTMPSVIIAGQTTMPSVIIAGQTTMPSVIIAGQTTMPSVIIAGQTTMPSVIIAGQTTMPSVIIAGQTTMPSVIIAGQTTMPSVIIAGQTTMPSVIIAGQTTMPSVIIAGPPGTGKTVTLALMGVSWLLQGHDVYVLSQSYETRAIAELICQQIDSTAQLYATSASASASALGKVHLLAYDMTTNDWEDMRKCVQDVVTLAAKGGPHRFILDDVMLGKESCLIDLWHSNVMFWVLEMFLKDQLVWMAGVTNHATPPSIQEAVFTIPLRCAPPIQREVQAGVDLLAQSGAAVSYHSKGIPAPTDGLAVIRLRHEGPGHSAVWPVDCQLCGLTIADLLHRHLSVARPAPQRGGSSTVNHASPPTSTSPAPLQYKDVFIVTRSSDLHDDVTDDAGRVSRSASGVVKGLRLAGVPLSVLGMSAPLDRARCQGIVKGMGLLSFDRVVLSFSTFLQGLERKVVVWLPGENRRLTDECIIESSEVLDRVHALSRCTTQLIMVDMPTPAQPDLD